MSNVEKLVQLPEGVQSKHLEEYECYDLFTEFGLNLPAYKYFPLANKAEIKQWMQQDKKYVLKCVIPGCLHKTDIGGVMIGVNQETCDQKVDEFIARLPNTLQGILVVEMASFFNKGPSSGEILLSGLYSDTLGPLVCLGFGGTTVEELNKIMEDANLFIPCNIDLKTDKAWRDRIANLPLSRYMLGQVRGIEKQVNNVEQIYDMITSVQKIMMQTFNGCRIAELEVNPCVVEKGTGKIICLDGVVKIEKIQQQLSMYKSTKHLENIPLLFAPKSVVLSGVSSKSLTNPCTVVLNKLLEINKTRKESQKIELFIIHPKSDEIFGVKCYRSFEDLATARNQKQIDLFVCGVPAAAAYDQLMFNIKSDFCKTTFLLSAGFGETQHGKVMEKELRAALVNSNHMVNGGNTLGYLWKDIINTVFVESKKSSATDNQNKVITCENTNCALLCQSGAFMITRLSDTAKRICPTLAMSVGNQMSLSNVDFLEWMLHEYEYEDTEENELINKIEHEKREIKIISMYIEGLNPTDGARLVNLLKVAKEQDKTVIIYKSGRTSQGQKCAAGHTASMSGSYSQFKQIFKTCGAILVDTLEEFEDITYLATKFSKQFIKEGLNKKEHINIGVMTNAGFEKVCGYGDGLFLTKSRLTVPTVFEREEELKQIFVKYHLENVIDLDQIIDTTPTIPDKGYYDLMKILADSKDVDLLICSPVPETHVMSSVTGETAKLVGRDFMTEDEDTNFAKLMVKLSKETDKPFIIVIESGWKYQPLRDYLSANGIAVFDKSDRASRALRIWLQ